MMKATRKIKQTLSVLLAVAMMVTAVPQNVLTVSAEETVEAVVAATAEETEEGDVSVEEKEDTAGEGSGSSDEKAEEGAAKDTGNEGTSSDEEKETDTEAEDVEEKAETEEENFETEETETEEDNSITEETESEEETVEEEKVDEKENSEIKKSVMSTSDTDIASGEYGNITWVIDANGKLTVEGTGDFSASKGVERAPWYQYAAKITSAEVKVSGMTDASYMFGNCTEMKSVDLSNFDTSQVTNMNHMFYYCKSLTSLDVSKFDTGKVEEMSGMFYSCYNLTSLDVSKFDTSNVKEMSNMFDSCSSLTSLDVSKFNTGQVTNMCAMFSGCENLTSLDVSEFDTSRVKKMYFMFCGCKNLTSLEVSNFDTSQVTDMNAMFSGCSGLTSLDVSSFDTSHVIDMHSMFYNCKNLTSLDVSNFDTSQVTNMMYMFEGCGSLTSLDVSSFDMSKSYVDDILDGCSKLATIYTPCKLAELVTLPKEKSSDVWYMPDGTTITELPQGLSYSIVIEKNKQPEIADPHITIQKTKTAYVCGDTIDTNDIKVTYYDGSGKISKVTEGYTTNANEIDMSTPGRKELIVTYQEFTASVELSVTCPLKAEEVTITLPDINYVYNGQAITPVPEVSLTAGAKLTADEDYTVSYKNNVKAGDDTAQIIITGMGNYSGSLTKTFSIGKAEAVVKALDMTILVDDPLPGTEKPGSQTYGYEVQGLVMGDRLVKEPSFQCDITSTKEKGTYTITPSGADAGSNYIIKEYQTGTLKVVVERVLYTVRFDMRGHGTAIADIEEIKAGSLIDEPAAPSADGFTFGGWYKDKACTKAWSFATETIQEDMTLYACWLSKTAGEGDLSLRIQEIPDQTYTGSALKPAVRVYAADGSTLLKAGKDYTIQYYNNTSVYTGEEEIEGGISKTGEEGDNGFSKNLAYVVIAGKGNYKGTVYSNFHILPASIGEGENAAAGITLKYTDQLTVNAGKAQKPFSSLKYKKALKAGTDFSITLTAVSASDADGTALEAGEVVDTGSAPAIPAGYCGTFKMQINGMNNYTGTISRTIHVADKSHLLKNASISLGRNQKKIAYREGEEITLAPGYYDAGTKKYYKAFEDGEVADIPEDNGNDLFTVKFGKTYLRYGKDYVIEYANNHAVGTATMTITGTGDYSGSKSVNFTITGTAFNTKNVVVGNDFKTSMPYTGKPLTQNRVTLTTKSGESLTYGVHYIIRYKNNIKKGTATMQFVAKPESGYSGSFNKTFKITAPELKEVAQLKLIGAQEGDKLEGDDGIYTLQADIPYSREGAKPADRISLVSSETGAQLKEGTDYTVSYANNKAVTAEGTAANKMPVMTIKGKGNYAGTLRVIFSISEAAFEENGNVKVTATPTAINYGKKADYEYQPKIKVTDGKQTLKAKKDYTVEYQNCKQSEVNTYLEALVKGDKTAEELKEMRPKAVIKALAGSGYKAEEKTIDLDIYQKKMSTTCLYVVVSQEGTTYTGAQLKPEVTVYYGSSKAVSAAKKAKETDEEVLTGESATYQLMKLKPDTDGTGDYHVSYGSNVAAGKNKGTVTVTGTGLYGGSVTTKFDIISRDVYR